MYQLCINNSIILCSIPYKGEILQAHIFCEQPKNRIVMFTLLAVRLITLQLVLHTLLMIIFAKKVLKKVLIGPSLISAFCSTTYIVIITDINLIYTPNKTVKVISSG